MIQANDYALRCIRRSHFEYRRLHPRIARSIMTKESEIKMFVFSQMNAQQGFITTKINEG
jgi:hypothetical protein